MHQRTNPRSGGEYSFTRVSRAERMPMWHVSADEGTVSLTLDQHVYQLAFADAQALASAIVEAIQSARR